MVSGFIDPTVTLVSRNTREKASAGGAMTLPGETSATLFPLQGGEEGGGRNFSCPAGD